MNGKTKQQLKTRFNVSIVLGIILVIVALVINLFGLEQINWLALIAMVFIAVPVFCIQVFAISIDISLITEMFTKSFSGIIFLFPFKLVFYAVLNSLKAIVLGVKGIIYINSVED